MDQEIEKGSTKLFDPTCRYVILEITENAYMLRVMGTVFDFCKAQLQIKTLMGRSTFLV